jgi:ELWxxDGT repeat protein
MSVPRLVADIFPGVSSSTPRSLIAIGDTLFFTAWDGVSGRELWKSDGTTAGTVRVADIRAGGSGSYPEQLTAVGGTLFFAASGAGGNEIWKSDGTTAGTMQVADINPGSSSSFPRNLTAAGDSLFFTLDRRDGVISGKELWKSDGTTEGTALVAAINLKFSFTIGSFTSAGSTLFFVADDGVSGYELWRSDGSAAGTIRIADINPGIGSSSPRNLVAVGNSLYFTAADASGDRELWKSDGTAAGTVRVADIYVGRFSSSPEQLTAAGSTLFFSADDGVTGRELWRSDGTAGGTARVADIADRSFSSSPQNLVAVGNVLYFSATDAINGRELWKSDGTAAGTVRVTDINAGSGSSNPTQLTAIGNTLYFVATDGVSGYSLWKTDGTFEGTERVADSFLGSSGFARQYITAVGNTLLFTADDGVSGRELWALDDGELPIPVVSLTATTASIAEDAGLPLVYTFTRTGPTGSALTVNYRVAGTARLRAVSGDPADYAFAGSLSTALNRTVTFAEGSATATVEALPIADARIEANETVTLQLTEGTGYTIATPAAVSGTIINDDFPTITLTATTASIAEDAGLPLVYTFTRTGPTGSALTVNYRVGGTARLRAVSGDPADYAFAGSHSTALNRTVTFAEGSATATVEALPIADARTEANETVTLQLREGTGYTIATPAAVSGTIINDDFPTITLTATTASIAEDAGSPLVYTFTRTGPTGSALTVNYRVGGTARLRATDAEPADYAFAGSHSTALNRTVTFAEGSATATVEALPIADARTEANETVTLQLREGTGYTIGTSSAIAATINNDDIESSVSYELAPAESNLRLIGARRINGSGNGRNNIIVGNSANNRIAGFGGKDTLTGGGGSADRDVFVFAQLSDSLLLEPGSGTGGYFDEITDFNNNDRILAPFSVETDMLTASVGVAASIAPNRISTLLNNAVFAANSVVAFTVRGYAGTFIAMNDGRPGFQAATDAIVFLQNYSISAQNYVEFV